jgi:hypothetical protein
LEFSMDSVLRPRDIQARIRSGEDPETVAAAAQTTVDKIMGFAAPVMAERAYVAEQAQKASVRRRSGDGTIGHLSEAVSQRLSDRHLTADDVVWDAWRRDDGRWTVVADLPGPGGSTRAHFVYDAAGRYVTAEDDDARRLVGEQDDRQDGDTEQLPLGDDAIQLVTGVRPTPEPLATDDWMLTQASERATPVEQPEEAEESEESEEPDTLFDPEPSPTVDAVVEPEQEPAKPRKSSKSRRASVPSWDVIMFGSGKGD